MAIKYTIAALAEVPGPLRELYVSQADGSFALDVEGHPDSVKNKELRSTNIDVMKQRDALLARNAAFEGIDPAAARAALAKAGGDDSEVVKLKLKLAEAESNVAGATQKADALVFRQLVSSAFVAAGGRPNAVDYIVSKVPFVLADGELRAKDGAQPTVEEWLKDQAVENPWVFLESRGGGAIGAKPGAVLGALGNAKQLINPSAAELGAAGADIKAGKVKVVYTT